MYEDKTMVRLAIAVVISLFIGFLLMGCNPSRDAAVAEAKLTGLKLKMGLVTREQAVRSADSLYPGYSLGTNERLVSRWLDGEANYLEGIPYAMQSPSTRKRQEEYELTLVGWLVLRDAERLRQGDVQ